jgi:hypothetical protein
LNDWYGKRNKKYISVFKATQKKTNKFNNYNNLASFLLILAHVSYIFFTSNIAEAGRGGGEGGVGLSTVLEIFLSEEAPRGGGPYLNFCWLKKLRLEVY